MLNSSNRQPTIFWATAAAAVLMIVGGFAPWATALGISAAGTSGDGWFLIIGGILAGALLVWHASKPRLWKAILIAVIALIGTIVAVVDLSNVGSVVGRSSGLVQVGWGLYVSLLSSIGLLAASVYTIVKRPYAGQAGDRSAEAPVSQPGAGGARAAPASQAMTEIKAAGAGQPEPPAGLSSGAAQPPPPHARWSRRSLVVAGVLLALVLAAAGAGVALAIGSGGRSPEDQVRAAWTQARDAAAARDAGKFCSLMTDDARGTVIVATALLTADSGSRTCEAAMRTLFDVSRDSLDKFGQAHLTSVTVHGNRATTTDSSGGSPTEWEKVNGRWLFTTAPDESGTTSDDADSDDSSPNGNGTTTTPAPTTPAPTTPAPTTPAPTTPAPTPSPAATDPAAIITQHFEDLNSGNYQGAFGLLTATYQARNPSWVSDRQAAAPRINVISVGTPQYGSGGAQVPVNFYARDRNATQGSDTKCRQFTGTVHMVQESGGWRYDPSGSSLNATVVDSTNPNCPS